MIQVASAREVGLARAEELERLGDEIATLAAHMHAATYTLLVRLLEFDRREGWGHGFRSCAHWLSWRTGIAPGAAREKVRVARALEHLPQLSDAMRRGEFSFAKVRAITRVATPENEGALVEVARHATAAHVERIVRAWRRVDRLEEQRHHDSRYLTVRVDENGMYEVHGRLESEVGVLLKRALEAGVEALYGRRPPQSAPDARDQPQVHAFDSTTAEQRRADALGLVVERALRPLTSSESDESASTHRLRFYEVVVHVDAEALRTESNDGESVLADGTPVSAETSRRLACDANRVIMSHDADGNVLDVGRRTRTVPSAIRRALESRDRECQFPGCGLRYCDAHHIVHWADGGSTCLENLVLLCRRHHRAVHEEGYKVERSESGELRFLYPDGRILPNAPPAVRLPVDAATTLQSMHREQGLQIDATTSTAQWNGERLDLDFAIRTLRRPPVAARIGPRLV